MPRPPAPSGTAVLGAALCAISLFAARVAAQRPPEFAPTAGFSLWLDAALAALVTLLIGGVLIAIAPEFTERTTDRVLDDPGETFLYGLGIFVVAIVVVVLLAITIVGLVLVVPLVVALVVIGEIGYLAAGRAAVDDWGPALLVAVVLSAFAGGVPYIGGLVGFVLASMGTGAWYLDYRDDGASADQAQAVDPVSGENDGSAEADAPADGTRDAADGPGDAWTAGFEDELDRN